jgi:hypothetical protein
LSDFNQTGIFSTDILKQTPQIANLFEIHQLGAKFHADRQTREEFNN